MNTTTIHLVKARDAYGNTSVLHEVVNYDEARELEEYERLAFPDMYVFLDSEDMSNA